MSIFRWREGERRGAGRDRRLDSVPSRHPSPGNDKEEVEMEECAGRKLGLLVSWGNPPSDLNPGRAHHSVHGAGEQCPSPGISRCPQVFPGISRHLQASPGVSQSLQVSPVVSKCLQMLPGISRCLQADAEGPDEALRLRASVSVFEASETGDSIGTSPAPPK